MTKIRNLTQHDVIIHVETVCPECSDTGQDAYDSSIPCQYCRGAGDMGRDIKFPPEGPVARVRMVVEPMPSIAWDGTAIPTVYCVPEEILSLPLEREDTLLIVSRLVAESASGRPDLIVPDDLLRDEQGKVTGARRFSYVGR